MPRTARTAVHVGALILANVLAGRAVCAQEAGAGTAAAINPAAIEHLPIFIAPPGQSDILFNVVVVFLVVMVLVIGNLYFKLHALPEHMAHRTSKVQLEIVAVLALISLFTHNHLFWIAGLLLALIELPDFSTPMSSMAASLKKIAGRDDTPQEEPTAVPVPAPSAGTSMSGTPSRADVGMVQTLNATAARKEPSHV